MSELADVHAASRPGELPCLSCGVHADARAAAVLLCAGCLARVHPACWTGVCGACGSEQALGPVRAAPERPTVTITPRRRPRRRLRVRRLALVLGLGVASALAVERTERTDRTEAVHDHDLAGWQVLRADAGAVDWRPIERLETSGTVPAGVAVTTERHARATRRAAMWVAVDDARRQLARGDRQGALADYDRALSLFDREPAPWVERARLRTDLGDHAGAVRDAERAIALAPGRVDARFQRALALAEVGRHAEATVEWTRVLALAPHDAAAWSNRGFARAYGGDPEGAVADCTRALELRPSEAYAFNNRAWARLQLGDLDEAWRDVTRSLELDPMNPWAYETRARVHERRAWPLALADLERCLSLSADYPRAGQVRATLHALRQRLRGAGGR